MSLGLCCQWIQPKIKRDGSIVYENIINECGLQLGQFRSGTYSKEKIISVYRNNINEIKKLIPKLVENNIRCFRLSSGILPLFEFNSELAYNDIILQNLFKETGDLLKTNNIRVTCHPGQFVVLSSDNEQVIQNSINDLVYHAWIFDQMGFDKNSFYAINIHGGKSNRTNILIKTINELPQNVKIRLTLENDELSYSVNNLLLVSKETNVPIVFDSHHHSLNPNCLDIEIAFIKCIETWNRIGIKPLQHISNSIPENENGNIRDRRKHSDFIYKIPNCQLNAVQNNLIDLEIEAKMKNIAIERIKKEFSISF